MLHYFDTFPFLNACLIFVQFCNLYVFGTIRQHARALKCDQRVLLIQRLIGQSDMVRTVGGAAIIGRNEITTRRKNTRPRPAVSSQNTRGIVRKSRTGWASWDSDLTHETNALRMASGSELVLIFSKVRILLEPPQI